MYISYYNREISPVTSHRDIAFVPSSLKHREPMVLSLLGEDLEYQLGDLGDMIYRFLADSTPKVSDNIFTKLLHLDI